VGGIGVTTEPPGDIRERIAVGPGLGWSGIVPRDDVLRIVDLEGAQAVDFLCYNAREHEERYHAPNTLKKAHTLRLTTGHSLYSDVAQPIFTIVADTHGTHDTIGGCCSAPSNLMLYGADNAPGCRETFLRELGKFGMGRRDIVPNVNFFCDVPVHDRYVLSETVFQSGSSRPGDYVDLRAEMDALAIVSNCRQTNNPCNAGRPTPIEVIIFSPRRV
jgi:urea carboxylase-associated protein 1